jgi:hypothetical protein
MGEIIHPRPVKLIFSIISGEEQMFIGAKKTLVKNFGRIDMESEYQPFNFTEYYKKEMGDSLKQKMFSFEKLILPDRLSEIKNNSNELEWKLSMPRNFKNTDIEKKRKVNFDPGYLTLGKFILASTKNGAARIYLKEGIYAEITLRFVNKSFRPLEWTYRNYQTDLYIDFLNKVREKYKKQLKIII